MCARACFVGLLVCVRACLSVRACAWHTRLRRSVHNGVIARVRGGAAQRSTCSASRAALQRGALRCALQRGALQRGALRCDLQRGALRRVASPAQRGSGPLTQGTYSPTVGPRVPAQVHSTQSIRAILAKRKQRQAQLDAVAEDSAVRVRDSRGYRGIVIREGVRIIVITL